MEKTILYLNSEMNCTRLNDSTDAKTIELVFNNISPIVLNEYSIMRLITIQHMATTGTHADLHGVKVLSYRLKNVLYNPELFRTNEKTSYPIVFVASYADNEPAYYDNTLGGIYLLPQTITSLSLILSDDIKDAFAGIDKKLGILIGLEIQPYDRFYSDYEN